MELLFILVLSIFYQIFEFSNTFLTCIAVFWLLTIRRMWYTLWRTWWKKMKMVFPFYFIYKRSTQVRDKFLRIAGETTWEHFVVAFFWDYVSNFWSWVEQHLVLYCFRLVQFGMERETDSCWVFWQMSGATSCSASALKLLRILKLKSLAAMIWKTSFGSGPPSVDRPFHVQVLGIKFCWCDEFTFWFWFFANADR